MKKVTFFAIIILSIIIAIPVNSTKAFAGNQISGDDTSSVPEVEIKSIKVIQGIYPTNYGEVEIGIQVNYRLISGGVVFIKFDTTSTLKMLSYQTPFQCIIGKETVGKEEVFININIDFLPVDKDKKLILSAILVDHNTLHKETSDMFSIERDPLQGYIVKKYK